jgi:hypothetical protein
MKKVRIYLACSLTILGSLVCSPTRPVKQEPTIINQYCSLILDRLPSPSTYLPYNSEKVESVSGFGVYHDTATANISFADDILMINYHLPSTSYFDPDMWNNNLGIIGGFVEDVNWISVRKEFLSIIDDSSCTGLQFDFKTDTSAGLPKLRLTVCDIDSDADFGKHGADKTWWYDFADSALVKANDWTTVQVPFDSLKVPSGAGTRPDNSLGFLRSKIVAYEINVIGQYEIGGRLEVRFVCSY